MVGQCAGAGYGDVPWAVVAGRGGTSDDDADGAGEAVRGGGGDGDDGWICCGVRHPLR